jgi:hypothetical protein
MSKDLEEWAKLFLPTRGDRIAEMYAEGASLGEIAIKFKDSKRSIARYLIPYSPTVEQVEKFKRDHVRGIIRSNPKK